MNISKKKFNISIVLFFCVIAIFMGKYIRHTVMKETLVIPGIGWDMVEKANKDLFEFGLTIKDTYIDESASNATANAGFIFEKLNLFNLVNSYYGYELLISIIWNFITILIILSLKKSYNFSEMMFIIASVAVLNIFDFTIAKEPVQMLYFILMYLILKSNKDKEINKFVKCFLVYLLCFFTFRNYYIIMAFYFIYIYLLYKVIISKIKKIKLKHIVLILFSIFICYYVILNIAKIVNITNYNELIRVRLRTSTASSDIRAIFKSTNLFLFTLDYLIIIIRMLIPIELLRLGPKYIIYIIYQIIISYILIKNIKFINKNSAKRRIALYIYISFLLGSATFEPDFGSWIRHEAVLFPIFMLMCGFDERRIKDEEEVI